MLTPFLLHTRYTEQNVNCFKIGWLCFGEWLGHTRDCTRSLHNHRKTVGAISGNYGSGSGPENLCSSLEYTTICTKRVLRNWVNFFIADKIINWLDSLNALSWCPINGDSASESCKQRSTIASKYVMFLIYSMIDWCLQNNAELMHLMNCCWSWEIR